MTVDVHHVVKTGRIVWCSVRQSLDGSQGAMEGCDKNVRMVMQVYAGTKVQDSSGMPWSCVSMTNNELHCLSFDGHV